MTRQIFVNLPVRDIARTRSFFESLGFEFNEKFSNDEAACLIVGDGRYVMLLAENFFSTFTHKPVCDARSATEVLVCLGCDSRAEVDDLVARARAAGGSVPRDAQDHGFMYAHAFEDPDGHIWELVYMAENAEAA